MLQFFKNIIKKQKQNCNDNKKSGWRESADRQGKSRFRDTNEEVITKALPRDDNWDHAGSMG